MSAIENGSQALHRPLPSTGFLWAGLAIVALMTIGLTVLGRHVTFGSSNVRFVDEGGVANALARSAVEAGVATPIPDDELRKIVEVQRTRAADGDSHAALLVFELAKIQ